MMKINKSWFSNVTCMKWNEHEQHREQWENGFCLYVCMHDVHYVYPIRKDRITPLRMDNGIITDCWWFALLAVVVPPAVVELAIVVVFEFEALIVVVTVVDDEFVSFDVPTVAKYAVVSFAAFTFSKLSQRANNITVVNQEIFIGFICPIRLFSIDNYQII